jgi:hypothetical protein
LHPSSSPVERCSFVVTERFSNDFERPFQQGALAGVLRQCHSIPIGSRCGCDLPRPTVLAERDHESDESL